MVWVGFLCRIRGLLENWEKIIFLDDFWYVLNIRPIFSYNRKFLDDFWIFMDVNWDEYEFFLGKLSFILVGMFGDFFFQIFLFWKKGWKERDRVIFKINFVYLFYTVYPRKKNCVLMAKMWQTFAGSYWSCNTQGCKL